MKLSAHRAGYPADLPVTGGRASAVFGGDHTGQVATLGFYVEKSKTFKKRTWPAGMVLLENFGPAFAEAASSRPFTVQFNRPNHNNFVLLLPRNVVQTMMLRIPKFRKESHPERAKNQEKLALCERLNDNGQEVVMV